MPGCGKTTVARILSKLTGRLWFDSDKELEKQADMCINDIFALRGEQYFRQLETKTLKRLLDRDGIILSTGGGAVLKNSGLLHDNSDVVYIYRSIDSIMETINTDTRPLLKDRESLERLFKQREALYENACHIKVENRLDLETLCWDIISKLHIQSKIQGGFNT